MSHPPPHHLVAQDSTTLGSVRPSRLNIRIDNGGSGVAFPSLSGVWKHSVTSTFPAGRCTVAEAGMGTFP